MLTHTTNSHDYLWARLPFLVPMAAKIARRCGGSGPDCDRLAELVARLHSKLLSHLDHEERVLATLSCDRDNEWIVDCLAELRAQHQQLLQLLEEVCEAAGLPREPGTDACPTVHAFYDELARLDRYLRAQLTIEDRVFATGSARPEGNRR